MTMTAVHELPRTQRLNCGPLRVYRSTADRSGVVLCVAHRDRLYFQNPASFGAGEFGGKCQHQQCATNRPATT